MSDAELAAAAKAQADALRPYIGTYDQFKDHVQRIVERAVREDKGVKLNDDGSLA